MVIVIYTERRVFEDIATHGVRQSIGSSVGHHMYVLDPWGETSSTHLLYCASSKYRSYNVAPS